MLSIEKNEIHYNLLKNNIEILNIDNIKLINDDFINYINLNNINEKYDLLFIDPPWGGPNYKNRRKY